MPWRRTDAVKERTKFVLEWERLFEKHCGTVNLSELCRAYGISRPTGYTWLKRYRDAGRDVRVLENRSRRPLSNPNAMTVEIEATLVAARKLHPRWGPRKLRAWLQDRFPDHSFPSPSTIGEALKRHGLVETRRRRRRHAPVAVAPFQEPVTPNGVWCIDFKGHFRTDDHAVCYPFTISDAFSRFLIRCEIVEDPDGDAVRSVLDSAFREFGVPSAIRSDNGPPFASTGAGGLTSLAVWLLRLGIRLERIVPGKPPAERQARADASHAQAGDRHASEGEPVPPAEGIRPVPARVQRGASARGPRPEAARDALHAVLASVSAQAPQARELW
jgi:putative transposase